MVYYDGQNMDLRNYINNFTNKLKTMHISDYDINFLINLMPITIGCTFYTQDIHIAKNKDIKIYELNLRHINFHDISLPGIIHIKKVDNEKSFVIKSAEYYKKEIPDHILSPKKYYVKFEKEYMFNIIFDELTYKNISLCNCLVSDFNCNKDDLQKFFNNENFKHHLYAIVYIILQI